ncbi:MAG TPA: ROK family protein [Solirubrobacteraceae bacterium]|nr:ROK family protein [Solirubrobacteraceae bacterium]
MRARGGIDLGGTKIQAVIAGPRHGVLGQARRPTPTAGGPRAVIKAMVATLTEAAGQAGIEVSALEGVGVGSPGEVDGETGTVANAGNLPGWTGSYPVREELEKQLGVAVAVGNDVSVATEAEARLGAGRPYNSFVGVFWGTGVGGGLIFDRQLWQGRGFAGEIGHMVVKLGGAPCPCGRRGCLEAYAGRASMERKARKRHAKGEKTVLLKIMREHDRPRMTSGVWARALEREDELALRIVNRAVEALGAGIASVINLLDLEAVIIGGGLGLRLGQPYVERIEAAMFPHLFVDQRPPAVHLAELGDLGGAIGASLLPAPPVLAVA